MTTVLLRKLFSILAIAAVLIPVSTTPPVMARYSQSQSFPPPFSNESSDIIDVDGDSPICGQTTNANSCCDYVSSGNPYGCCYPCIKYDAAGMCLERDWGTDTGNCVWWAWKRFYDVAGEAPPCGGSAYLWADCAEPVGALPRLHSVVVFPKYYWPNSSVGHVAFVEWVDNAENPSIFKVSQMSCYSNCDVRDEESEWYTFRLDSRLRYIYTPGTIDTTSPKNPTSVSSSGHTVGQWANEQIVTIEWSGATDPGDPATGVGGYSWVWTQSNNTVPDTKPESDETTASTTSPPLSTHQGWYFHIRTRDKSNNWADGATHYGPFWIDASVPPNPFNVIETHGAISGWQNSVYDPAFTWSAALDDGSGVDHYVYYWGEDENGTPDTMTTSTNFDPPAACGVNESCTKYLRLQVVDKVGNSSTPYTAFKFQYDGQSPAGTFEINNGSDVTFQVEVDIQTQASDAGSGLASMRLSNDGFYWPEGWQVYSPITIWEINNVPNITQTVYMDIRDGAGNITSLSPQTIQLDTSGSKPSSATYQILTDVQGRGGGSASSSTYSLITTSGQTIAGNGTSGEQYQLESGFIGAMLASPTGVPPVEHYQLLDSTVGQGGGYKISGIYQMNATMGQSTFTGNASSASYGLVSGYWARVVNISVPQVTPTPTSVVDTPTLTPTETPTETATPTPEPEPEFYGISVNNGALFTKSFNVELYLDGMDAVEMMVSNDGGFGEAYWEAYAVTKTWEIDFYQDYVLPRTVYVRYKDAEGTIYGNFTDDIIYDPTPPSGDAAIVELGADSVTLALNMTDNLSGIDEVKVATFDTVDTAEWEPYASYKSIPATEGDTILVFYRDSAGNDSIYPVVLPIYGASHIVYMPLSLKNTQ